jgi:GntR family transcriptional regulator
MTVRHAVDGLVREGLLVRKRGSGTYVTHSGQVSRSINRLQGFSADVAEGSGVAGARVISMHEIAPSPEVSEKLELTRGGKVVELIRVRTIGGEASAINQVWIPVLVAPELMYQDMNDRSLYDYLAGVGVVLDAAEQRIFAAAAERWQADLLGVPVDAPLLGSERVTRDPDNSPVEYAASWSLPTLSVWVHMRR